MKWMRTKEEASALLIGLASGASLVFFAFWLGYIEQPYRSEVTFEDLIRSRDQSMHWCAAQGGSIQTYGGESYNGCILPVGIMPKTTAWDEAKG